MKKLAIILLFIANCYAVTGDINSDGFVNTLDLRIFADEWLTSGTYCDFNSDSIVNFLDFMELAENWQGEMNIPPVVSDMAFDANTYEIKHIPLTATDAESDSLQYYITRDCCDVNSYLQDPASGVGKIEKFNHRLRNDGNTVWFSPDNNETFTFKYKAFDGLQYSNEANCVVDVVVNPLNQLSFDGSGYVTVADSCNFDLMNKRGIAMYVKTHCPKGTLCSKYTSGSAGYIFQLVNGKPTVRLYSTSGLISTVTGTKRIDNGLWQHIGFVYDANGFIRIDIADEATTADNHDYQTTGWIEVSAIDYNNTADFAIGENFKGEIDNIRFYLFTNITGDAYYAYDGYTAQSRSTAGTLVSWGGFTLCPAAIVRFLCDYDGVNNTASQIYDDLANHYTGTISSSTHVKYEPFNPFWMDINVLQYRYKRPTVNIGRD